MSKKVSSQSGFSQLLLILPVALIVSLVVFSQVPITREYASGQSSVAGVEANPGVSKEVKLISFGGQTAFIHGVSGAVSKYRVKFDERSGAILVATPLGIKAVNILPDAAVKSALYARVIDNVGSVSPQGVFGSINQLAKLENKGGVLAYVIKGDKEYKILGVIPLKFNVSATVSAENGKVMDSTSSLLSRILGKLTS